MKWLISKFNAHKEKTAIIYNDKEFSYAQLTDKINEYINYLRHNSISPGSTVLLSSNFSFNSIAFFLANAINSNIIALVENKSSLDLENIARDSYSDYIFTLGEDITIGHKIQQPKHKLIDQLQSNSKAGLILFSSGTTGVPKIMLHDLSLMISNYKSDSVKDINSLILMGFDHIGGVDSLFRLLSICATITLSESRNPDDICRIIEKYRVQVLPATPTFFNLLILSEVYKKYELSSVNIIGYGAEPMPDILLNKIRAVFPSAKIQQKFGTTETNAIKIYNNPGDEQYFQIKDEKVEYKIVNNELWLKSKNNMVGYLNIDNQPFIEGNWINTGDLVHVREDGYIKILGRKKEVINVGGEKVLPVEVENYLLKHPHVDDCKVYGIPNLLTGSAVGADIVLKKDAPENIKSEIIKFCKLGLPTYKIPVKLKFVDSIELSSRQKKIRNND